MALVAAAYGWETKKVLPKFCHIFSYSDEISSGDISILKKISKFCFIKKYWYKLHFHKSILILFYFSEFIKAFFNKCGCNLDDVSKIDFSKHS